MSAEVSSVFWPWWITILCGCAFLFLSTSLYPSPLYLEFHHSLQKARSSLCAWKPWLLMLTVHLEVLPELLYFWCNCAVNPLELPGLLMLFLQMGILCFFLHILLPRLSITTGRSQCVQTTGRTPMSPIPSFSSLSPGGPVTSLSPTPGVLSLGVDIWSSPWGNVPPFSPPQEFKWGRVLNFVQIFRIPTNNHMDSFLKLNGMVACIFSF